MAERHAPDLVLASASPARRKMLEAAGVSFRIVPAEIDEAAIRQDIDDGGRRREPEQIARTLAQLKAESVGRRFPEALVIGADQVLAVEHDILEKPHDLSEAREGLLRLRGKTHRLCSAVALVTNGRLCWQAAGRADMTMRPFSEQFLDAYLAKAGSSVCSSVGAYRIEELGIQLFEHIAGDYFTILGLPLLPLLAELRARGALVD